MKRSILLLSTFLGASLPALAEPITATLTLQERVSMDELIANINNPHSDHFTHYYTPEEIRELAAPTDEDYATILDTLRSNGFSIEFESKSHLVLTIKGEAKAFDKMFHTQIQFGIDGMHASLSPAQIPESLPFVASISGLNKTHKFRPHYKKFYNEEATGDTQPGILPDAIKAAYGLTALYEAGYNAENQHIAIATYMNFSLDDVRQYYDMVQLNPLPQVDAVTFNGNAAYDSKSATETELDAELAGMIAPGASVHVFTSSENSESGETSLFTAILDDNRAKVVNYSWGMCETQVEAQHRKDMDKVFARAVAQGVNIFIASGDSGSDGCGDGGKVSDWPASNPNIIAVGGTSLYLDGIRKEVSWSGSGGGVSSFYDRPIWQILLRVPYLRRSFPDVSFNADPSTGQGIWVRESFNGTPSWQQIGGTSMAAPQWVGFLALVNEVREKRGLKTLGFLNPIIYNSTIITKNQILYDITSGNNGAYKATIGWDAVTGWGSLKGAAMLKFLSKK